MNYSTKASNRFLLKGGLALFLLFVLVGHASAGTYIWREAEATDTSVGTGPNRDWCATDTSDPGGDWSQNSHLVFGNGETTYDINFPEAGTYHLWLRYAVQPFGDGKRPTDIYLDGGLVLANGTNSVTGGWCGRHAIWEEQTTLTITTAGEHTLKLDAVGSFWAHIDTILLTTDGAFTPPDMWSSGGGFSNADDPPICVVPPPGMVSWWPLDESSGTTTADFVDSNPGAVQGGAVFVAGKVANALDFDGTNDTVEIAHNANLKPSTEITIDAWIKPNVVNGLLEIFRKEDGNDRSLLSFQPGGFCGVLFAGSMSVVSSPCLAFGISTGGTYKEFEVGGTIISDLVDGNFHHVAATYDGASRKIYIDGNLEGSIADSGTIGTNGTAPAFIGSGAGSGEFFNGVIDEVEFFDRALSASEIQAIFDAGSAGKCKVSDGDSDGVLDNDDFCPSTAIPEGVPTLNLNPNHWALTDDDGIFDTVLTGKGKGPNRSYIIEDTAGCSCEQIVEIQGLGGGHTKHGCSISAMDDFIESFVNP